MTIRLKPDWSKVHETSMFNKIKIKKRDNTYFMSHFSLSVTLKERQVDKLRINYITYLFQGYFRKGEVELRTFRFGEALKSYSRALSLQPNEPKILEAINTASRSLIKDQRGILNRPDLKLYENRINLIKFYFTADQQIPWLGAGVGIILGVIVVIADYVFTNKPTLTVCTM